MESRIKMLREKKGLDTGASSSRDRSNTANAQQI